VLIFFLYLKRSKIDISAKVRIFSGCIESGQADPDRSPQS